MASHEIHRVKDESSNMKRLEMPDLFFFWVGIAFFDTIKGLAFVYEYLFYNLIFI